MNLGNSLSNTVIRLDQFKHQGQIKAFEVKLDPQGNANKSFLNNLFKVSQATVSRIVGAAIRNPASALVYALLASGPFGANARAYSRAYSDVLPALEECFSARRHESFPVNYASVRCLGEVANDICSGRSPGSSGRYGFHIRYRESDLTKRDLCRQLLSRAAGIFTSIPSAYKTPDQIIKDVVLDVKEDLFYGERMNVEANKIIRKYGLRGEVDVSIMTASDVWDWISRHRPELEDRRSVDAFDTNALLHAADNIFKESGDIRDQDTYRQVVEGILDLDLEVYRDDYYVALADRISEKLYV